MNFRSLRAELSARQDVVFGSGTSATVVARSESALSLSFPAQLVEYLIEFGTLDLGHHELFGLGTGIPRYRDLVQITTSERTEVGRPIPGDLVPLLNDGAGNLVCIRADDAGEGQIVFWDHAAPPSERCEPYCESLIDFIRRLAAELDADQV